MGEKKNQVDENGQLTSLYEFHYFNGTLMGEGHYIESRRTGLWHWFTNDGKLTEAEIYII